MRTLLEGWTELMHGAGVQKTSHCGLEGWADLSAAWPPGWGGGGGGVQLVMPE